MPSMGGLGRIRQVRDQVEVVQRPHQNVRGQALLRGEDLAARTDPKARVGECDGASPTS